jgi:hypothetical protein
MALFIVFLRDSIWRHLRCLCCVDIGRGANGGSYDEDFGRRSSLSSLRYSANVIFLVGVCCVYQGDETVCDVSRKIGRRKHGPKAWHREVN